MLNTIQKREEVNQISWVEASQEKAIQKTKNIEKLLHDSEKTENKINKVKKEINIKKYMKQKMSEIKKFYNNQTKIIDSVSYKELKDWL